MTTLASILAAHGINPDTISTTGPATRLGEELERWASEREARVRRSALVHAASLIARQATDDEGDYWRRLALAVRDEADGKRVAEVEPVRAGEGPAYLRDEWQQRAWDTLRDLGRALARAEAAEARHRRHLLRLRWRKQRPRMSSRLRDRLQWREGLPRGGKWFDIPIAGPFPGNDKREPGRLP